VTITDTRPQNLREVFLLFLKLGFTAFGGPAAHIGIMHEEVVVRRKWLSDAEFLDLLGATNLIPGPNSTEMAIHIGFLRAGWPGLVLGGAGFILPAVGIVMVLSWVYVQFGTTPQAGWLLYGIKPVVIAIILQALWSLGRKAVKGPLLAVCGIGMVVLYLLGVNELLLLLIGGVVVMIGSNLQRLRTGANSISAVTFILNANWAHLPILVGQPFSLPVLFLTFLKIGAVLYGGGYVLLAFLQADFVDRLGWLTTQQLTDAVAIGQFTPGPLFTTATFIGYLLGGVGGGLLATLGIFLPSFIFVAISNPFIPKVRKSTWLNGLLDGVNVASLALMAVVTWKLGQASLVDPLTTVLMGISLFLIIRFHINSTWLIAGGALLGLVSSIL